MMDELKKKLMSKKDSESLSEQEKQAKMDVLMELLQMAQEAMGGKVKSGMDEMHKVSVMAKNPEDLKAGLEQAEEVVEEVPEMEEKEEVSEEKPEILADEEDEDDGSIFNKLSKKKKE